MGFKTSYKPTTLRDMIPYLQNVKQRGEETVASCPVCEAGDSNGHHLYVRESDGKLLAYCQKCHAKLPEILKALLFVSPEKTDAVKERDLLEVAVHEAGHVVAAEVLEAGCVAITSVRSHTGGSDGITCVNYDNNNGRRMKQAERHVIRSLAGKAASEIVLGMVDVGCGDDMAGAFHRVERLANNFCAYGFDAYESSHSSEALKAKKEQLVAEKMAGYYQAAKQLLAENRVFLDKVTEELMRKKTLRRKILKKSGMSWL